MSIWWSVVLFHGMGLLMQLLVIATALTFLHGSSAAYSSRTLDLYPLLHGERSALYSDEVLLGSSGAAPASPPIDKSELPKPPISLSPQRATSAPLSLTSPRFAPLSEPRGPALSPVERDIAAPPPLISPVALPPFQPPKDKIPIAPPTRSISISAPISPPKKMIPRNGPITQAVTPTSLPLRGSPLQSPLPKHPIVPGSPCPMPSNNGTPPFTVSPTSVSAPPMRKWHSREVAPPPTRLTLRPAPRKRNYSPSSAPKPSVQKHQGYRNKIHTESPSPSFASIPRSSNPGILSPPPQPPKMGPKRKPRHIDAPPFNHEDNPAPAPSPAPKHAPNHNHNGNVIPSDPYEYPPNTTPKRSRGSFAPPVLLFPPPPPNEDCRSFLCIKPFTNTLPGEPCGCVRPMQVGLRLAVDLYTFFPLVTKLAEEIAVGVSVNQNQVRIMGANAANQQPDKTVVLIDLVPAVVKFDSMTAFLIFNRLWNKKVSLGKEFGDYDVLYVRYPGLPLPPPTAPSDIADNNGYPAGNGNSGVVNKPFGVDVHKSSRSHRLSSSAVAVIVLSISLAVISVTATACLVIFRCRHLKAHSDLPPQPLLPSRVRHSGATNYQDESKPGSVSVSFASSIAANIGSAKTFSYAELQKATSNFDVSKVVGEGGFGCVYSGVLEDGTHVAVKVLKRDDHHGDREYMAEVEMLSRLHHRHLVKLIGICIEAHNRCLIYELVPNGSVESHLHGQDKERSPLDWATRLKIALGAARGLAYLHEDSNPRVIHRDFKSSNILLENDFTPKVSDFGLARTGMEEKNGHISTRVMGTFGYVAPEYAMTGHLLVKSDVYSYGVVLLELLTGRKPVDMSQPPGEENLVSWARPLLTSREGLESLLDKSLGPVISSDSVAKVAAIASLCVQPEVSLRPYMGEVVQALKLVCNESEDTKDMTGSSTCTKEDITPDVNNGITGSSSQFSIPIRSYYRTHNSNSESDLDYEMTISVSEPLQPTSSSLLNRLSGSFRRHSTSGPLTSGRRRHFWRRIRRVSRNTVNEPGNIIRLPTGSH